MKKTDEAELLAWLDGELNPERRAEIQQQLEADWELRTRLAQLERRIGKYIEATAHQSPVEIEPFDDFWQRFTPQLDELTAPQIPSRRQATIKTLITRLSKVIAPQQYGWRLASVAGIALLITAGLILYLSLSTRVRLVSAEELLQRSISGEDLRVKQLAEPVVYRKLQVKRVGASESVTWESWNDAQRNQYRQRVADRQGLRFLRANEKETPAVIAELAQIFRTNHFAPQHPLSASAFAEWRTSVQPKTETVAASNNELTLTTTAGPPPALNVITEAALTVRKSDWHAVALQIKVQGEQETREYELRETAYEVLPLQALTVFADLAPTPSPLASPTTLPTVVAALPVASASPSVTSTVALPSATALQEAEVAALFTLHQLKADLGEQIEVLRDANRQIIVRGLVETEVRKQQLNEALRAVPLVIANLQTAEEAARQVTAKTPDNAVETTTIVESQISAVAANATSANPFHQHLEKYFIARGNERRNAALKAAQLSDTVVSEAAAALSEAWALRRLAERFKSEQEDEFTAVNRQRITEMMRNHLARLQAQHRSLRTQLDPVLSALAGTIAPPAVNSAGNRQAQALQLFKAVEQFAQLSNNLFAGTGGGSPVEAARRTLTALAQMDGALQSFEQTMSK